MNMIGTPLKLKLTFFLCLILFASSVQAGEVNIRMDLGSVTHKMQGGIGASWHAISAELSKNEKESYPWPLRHEAPRGSAWGGNPPVENKAAWRQVCEHARWLGLDWLLSHQSRPNKSVPPLVFFFQHSGVSSTGRSQRFPPAGMYRYFLRDISVGFRPICQLFSSGTAGRLPIASLTVRPHYVGGQVGVMAVLHTWGSNLSYHLHVHCLVTGGGLSSDRQKWMPARDEYLVPVKALSRLFRKIFRKRIERRFRDIRLPRYVWQKEWVAHSKPAVQGTRTVLNYLARYIHRVAITNSRIISIDNGNVTFRYKDSKSGAYIKTMTVSAEEFIRRFLQHALPAGVHKVRYYGMSMLRKSFCRGESNTLCKLPYSTSSSAINLLVIRE
jgi:hypothetical protein